jgi:dTDP-glucose 4,6-dehydratase
MRIIVTGGAGFLGSHLCERLLDEGHEVICVDNLITGSKEHVERLQQHETFTYVPHDVRETLLLEGPVDAVLHFASPASPVDFPRFPIEILETGALGTRNALALAAAKGATLVLASTSEVYGDPEVNPQPESYWGRVNPIGPRSVYDEAKRYAEALTMAFHRASGLDTRIVRIFNTYGPRMRVKDGRVIPQFISQALAGVPLTVHGDGSQTRSFCYVDDLVEGIVRLLFLDAADANPVNLGNPEEISVLGLAGLIKELTGAESKIEYIERPVDDPTVRRPDISRARALLGWEPKVDLREGLGRTIEWFRRSDSRT